jgi:hypothetical protein
MREKVLRRAVARHQKIGGSPAPEIPVKLALGDYKLFSKL